MVSSVDGASALVPLLCVLFSLIVAVNAKEGPHFRAHIFGVALTPLHQLAIICGLASQTWRLRHPTHGTHIDCNPFILEEADGRMQATETDHSHDGADRPVTNRAHPRIYTIVVGLCGWFALMAWNFATGGLVDYLLIIVSGFIFIATTLTLILFRVGGNKNNGTTPSNVGDPPLRDWVGWDYETRTGRIRGIQAAAQILLPIVAAAVGMTLIGIVFHFAA